MLRLAALPPLALAAILAGCGGGASGAPDAGVRDVVTECQVRAAWSNATQSVCTTCTALAQTPHCSCTNDPASGACESQEQAMLSEPDCTAAITSCVVACARTDCACVGACYAGHDACRAAASAVATCVVSTCDATCR